MRNLATGDAHEFGFDARNLWGPTDCALECAGRYRLDVVSQTEPWIDGWIRATPERGWPWWTFGVHWYARSKARAPAQPMYALVGAIARDPTMYFAALSPNEWSAPRDGALELFANDWEGRYDNNQGRLVLRLSRL